MKHPRINHSTQAAWEEKAAYSRAVRVGPFIEIAGTTASDGREFYHEGDLKGQCEFIFNKIEAALEAVGGEMKNIVRTRMYLKDASQWQSSAEVHYNFFKEIKPVMTLVEANFVHPKILVEIEASAIVESNL